MIRELKLGQASLFKLAAGITQTETGLVSGQQVAAYVQQHLSSGSTESWNGGTVTNPVTFNADVIIGYGPPVWIKYSNTNAGCAWDYIPQEAVPTKGQIEEFVHEKKLSRPASGNVGQYLQLTASGPSWSDPPASGQSYYENSVAPHVHAARTALPLGWYGVELLLHSEGGADCNYLLNPAALSHIRNIMGMAYGGTDNSSCPYATYNGITWLDNSGYVSSRPMASVLHMTFLYHHIGPLLSWPSESFCTIFGEWTTCSVRYTGIPEPRSFTAS